VIGERQLDKKRRKDVANLSELKIINQILGFNLLTSPHDEFKID
jgi:hypothetical protein